MMKRPYNFAGLTITAMSISMRRNGQKKKRKY